jgi:predicted RNase H-like HicB family nuclease
VKLSPHIHAVIYRSDDQHGYVAECQEISVVTQGGTLDEVTANLSEAVALHLEDEDPQIFGLTTQPTLQISLEVQPAYA